MKLFKTTDIEIVKCCQDIFRFEVPSVRLDRLKKRFLASYSSVDNWICRHVLITDDYVFVCTRLAMSSGSNSHSEVMRRIGLTSSVIDRLSRIWSQRHLSLTMHEMQAILQLHSCSTSVRLWDVDADEIGLEEIDWNPFTYAVKEGFWASSGPTS